MPVFFAAKQALVNNRHQRHLRPLPVIKGDAIAGQQLLHRIFRELKIHRRQIFGFGIALILHGEGLNIFPRILHRNFRQILIRGLQRQPFHQHPEGNHLAIIKRRFLGRDRIFRLRPDLKIRDRINRAALTPGLREQRHHAREHQQCQRASQRARGSSPLGQNRISLSFHDLTGARSCHIPTS